MKRHVEVEIEKHDSSSILLGSVIGEGKLPNDKKMSVVGSGNTVAFIIEGIEYRANIAVLANVALKMHTGELLADDVPHTSERRIFEAVVNYLKESGEAFNYGDIEVAVSEAIQTVHNKDYYCDIHG